MGWRDGTVELHGWVSIPPAEVLRALDADLPKGAEPASPRLAAAVKRLGGSLEVVERSSAGIDYLFGSALLPASVEFSVTAADAGRGRTAVRVNLREAPGPRRRRWPVRRTPPPRVAGLADYRVLLRAIQQTLRTIDPTADLSVGLAADRHEAGTPPVADDDLQLG